MAELMGAIGAMLSLIGALALLVVLGVVVWSASHWPRDNERDEP